MKAPTLDHPETMTVRELLILLDTYHSDDLVYFIDDEGGRPRTVQLVNYNTIVDEESEIISYHCVCLIEKARGGL